MVKPAAHQKAIGAWDLRSVGQSASQPLKLCMKLLGEVDEEKGKPMAMEMGRDYPLQVLLNKKSCQVSHADSTKSTHRVLLAPHLPGHHPHHSLRSWLSRTQPKFV